MLGLFNRHPDFIAFTPRIQYLLKYYETRRNAILDQLRSIILPQHTFEHLEKMAKLLANMPAAWAEATPEQHNKLARCLFDQVWLKDKNVIAVKPVPDMEPFFG